MGWASARTATVTSLPAPLGSRGSCRARFLVVIPDCSCEALSACLTSDFASESVTVDAFRRAVAAHLGAAGAAWPASASRNAQRSVCRSVPVAVSSRASRLSAPSASAALPQEGDRAPGTQSTLLRSPSPLALTTPRSPGTADTSACSGRGRATTVSSSSPSGTPVDMMRRSSSKRATSSTVGSGRGQGQKCELRFPWRVGAPTGSSSPRQARRRQRTDVARDRLGSRPAALVATHRYASWGG